MCEAVLLKSHRSVFWVGGFAAKYGYPVDYDINMNYVRDTLRSRGFVVKTAHNVVDSLQLNNDGLHFSSDVKAEIIQLWTSWLNDATLNPQLSSSRQEDPSRPVAPPPQPQYVEHSRVRNVSPCDLHGTILEAIGDYDAWELPSCLKCIPIRRGQTVCCVGEWIVEVPTYRFQHYIEVCFSGAMGGQIGFVPYCHVVPLWLASSRGA